MTLADFRALFPTTQKCFHLNHAGTSPASRPVTEAVQMVLEELSSSDSSLAYINHNERQEELRAALGRMLNVPSDTLGFTRNTSHSISIISQAVPFSEGDNVVIPAMEYPSNVYPWMAQQHRGVEVRLIPSRENGMVAEADLLAACDSSTRVLAVSWVQWTTGQKLDLQRLGEFCRERGILLAVDVVQGLGGLRLDLGSLPVDFASFGSHKWLLAPGGVGGLYVREEVFPMLLPVNIGWNSVRNPIEWDRLHFEELRENPKRFEEGTPSILSLAGLWKSVELLEAVGFDAVEQRVLELSALAHRLLTERGMRVVTSPEDALRSGIVGFRHPELPHSTVLAAFATRNVVAVERGGNLRFSPHAYNLEEEIEVAVEAIP